MCSTLQESVPASGLTCCDQRQPGWKVPSPTWWPLRSTSSTCPWPSVNSRTSSGVSKRLLIRFAIIPPRCSSRVAPLLRGSSDEQLARPAEPVRPLELPQARLDLGPSKLPLTLADACEHRVEGAKGLPLEANALGGRREAHRRLDRLNLDLAKARGLV